MPLDAAVGQPGAGVIILERTDEEGNWLPMSVVSAAAGFGNRIQSLMNDVQTMAEAPDWGQFRVRLGTVPTRPGNGADRAALRAISLDVSARIQAGGAGAGLLPAPEPTSRQQQLLQERQMQDSGVVPDYLPPRQAEMPAEPQGQEGGNAPVMPPPHRLTPSRGTGVPRPPQGAMARRSQGRGGYSGIRSPSYRGRVGGAAAARRPPQTGMARYFQRRGGN